MNGADRWLEVWLRLDGQQVVCSIVSVDESAYRHPIGSPSMQGAKREVSAYLIANGQQPDGVWIVSAVGESGRDVECWRMFKPAG